MELTIGDKKIGDGHPCFIIAELSANHHHDYEIAAQTVRAAKACGVDAIKLQTYTPDTITIDADHPCFKIKQGTVWDGKTLYQLYQEAYMPWEWQPKLKQLAEELGLICFSSPFDLTAVDFLEKMEVPAYKVASFEITDIPLIEYIAAKGKPIIISTGIAGREDVQEALAACHRQGNHQVALLKCTSSYPTPFSDVNLRTIPHMQEIFHTLVGLSDHTLGISVPVAAVALGAKIIEKHIILERSLGGPDAGFSLEPEEFKVMVQAVRQTEEALGLATLELSEKGKKSREFARSLFIVQDIRAGDSFTSVNVRSIRPGFGLHPRHLPEVLAKCAKQDVKRGTPLSWDLIA